MIHCVSKSNIHALFILKKVKILQVTEIKEFFKYTFNAILILLIFILYINRETSVLIYHGVYTIRRQALIYTIQ